MGLHATLLGKVLGKPAATTPTTPTTPTAPNNQAPRPPPAARIPRPVQPRFQLKLMSQRFSTAWPAQSPEKLDWKTSIVDLMKLVGMDSSLSARKELAKELHYDGDTNDSAATNIWLHRQVIQKIAENGGKVPQNLLS
jgi:hypothetical protein